MAGSQLRKTQILTMKLGTFLSDKPLTERSRQGFEDDWLFPPFGPQCTSFASRLEDELDVYAVLHLLLKCSVDPEPTNTFKQNLEEVKR